MVESQLRKLTNICPLSIGAGKEGESTEAREAMTTLHALDGLDFAGSLEKKKGAIMYAIMNGKLHEVMCR